MHYMRWLAGLVLACFLLGSLSASAQDDRLQIEGKLIQGTADGEPIPSGMVVELVISTTTEGIVERFQTTSNPDGSFVFSNIPRYDNTYFYTVAVAYAGLPQISAPVTANELSYIELPVYETTTVVNASQVRIVNGTMLINFTDVQRLGLQIILEFTVLNVSDRILYGSESTMTVELPVGAYGMIPTTSLEDPTATSASLLEMQTGAIPLIRETAPIMPGVPHTIAISYFLPYQDGAVIHQVFPMDITGFSVWVPEDTVALTSDMFTRAEDVVTVENINYHAYDQNALIQVDANGDADVIFTLGGAPTRTIRPQASNNSTNTSQEEDGFDPLLLIIGAVLVAILVVVFWLYGRYSTPTPKAD